MSEFQAIDVAVKRCLLAYGFKPLVVDGDRRPAEHGLPIVARVSVFVDFKYFEQRLATISHIDIRHILQVVLVTLELVTSVVCRFQQAR